MRTNTIYYNPRCSKCRQTLALLEARGIKLDAIEYLQTPPSVEELDAICRLLGVEPRQLIRTGEPRFAELGLTLTDHRPRAEWLKLMVENPVLIERPIVLYKDRAVVGRPPEAVLRIL